jgi:ppGpp synthetase/RelA/SpoT-type nucleotidyltranferase
MAIPPEIARRYMEYLPFVKAAAERVGDRLRTYCGSEAFLYCDRIKSLESTAEKIETGRFSVWADIDDLYAGTIIIPLLSQEEGVITRLSAFFDVIEVKTRGNVKKAPDVFRFDAPRVIARLKPPDAALAEGEMSASGVSFEIQIASVFEYAWSTSTHALAYKAKDIDWRRQRLAAQLKAAVEQLDMLVLGYDKIVPLVGDCTWPSMEDQRKIAEFFKGLIASGALPAEYEPQDWTRCSQNLLSIFYMYGAWTKWGSNLQELDEFLACISKEVAGFGTRGVPAGLSLSQFVHGVMGSVYAQRTIRKPMPVIGQARIKELFPSYHMQCPEFRTE